MENNLAAVIVETRPLPNLQKVIENHLKFLPDYTTLYVFGSDKVDLLLSQAPFKYEFHNIGDKLSIWGYNLLLTSKQFWESIQEENILIFQHDSEILRHGIEDFYAYDYVGAPWKFQQHGGNGGLSFRKRSAMIKVIDKSTYHEKQGNEDVFFCNSMVGSASGGREMHYWPFNPAHREINKKFSCESIFQLGTFGCHAIDKYLTPQECDKIRRQYEYTVQP
jgi:hypothetical protein